LLSAALRGRTSAAPETLDPGFLVLAAAAPVRAADGGISGVLFGGVVLTGDTTLVDGALDLFSDGGRTGTWAGRTSLFLGDRRVSTTLRSATGVREVGSRADRDVARAVLERGETWSGAVRAGEQTWVAAYAPLANASGERIGMIAVGVPSAVWIGIRNRVIVSFYLLATVGFLLIAALTWRMIGQITRPLDEMVEATRRIAAGRLDQAVATPSQKEIAALAASFNEMTERLREMKKEQGEWARTLAERVRERTEEVVALQGRISQSERLASVGMLAAGVAHEINNPLGGILALTSLTLEDLPPDAPDRESLEEVVRQAERCRDIVKGLLEFSRQSQVHTEPGDLDGILDAALALLRRQSLFFNVEVVRERGPDLPPVFVDRTKLEEVFLNVLMNAAQAMDGCGTIRISTRADEDGDHVSIRIRDTGRGIPPEQLPHVFDPFFTTRTGGEGTGLGLAIAYGIVTEHRGTISVESEPGRGTTFTIRLPVSRYAETVRPETPSVS
jgi:two-component system NtrC family sensor kinase